MRDPLAIDPFTPNGLSFVDSLGDILLLLMAASVLYAWVYYWRFFGWTKTPAGRALWTFLAALFIVLAQNSLARFAGVEYPLRDYVRTSIYLGGVLATGYIIFSLRHYKKMDDQAFAKMASRIAVDAFEKRKKPTGN